MVAQLSGSSDDLLKMQLLTTVQCTVYADVLWSSTFLHFIQHVLFVPCLLQCVYVYVCISVSPSFTSPSLWKSLWVYFSLCFSLLIFHLTHPSFLSLWISLTCSLSPGFFFQISLLFQLGERYTVWYTDLYLASSVTTANLATTCISNCSLVKEHKKSPPPHLLLWGSMRRIQWDGNSNANVCQRWDFLFIRYLISITSLIPKTFYLEGLYCYIPPFYRGGDWDTTWLYGLSLIAEKNL